MHNSGNYKRTNPAAGARLDCSDRSENIDEERACKNTKENEEILRAFEVRISHKMNA